VDGTVLYNKKAFSEFVVERTAAYVDQVRGSAPCSRQKSAATHVRLVRALGACSWLLGVPSLKLS
jgi:hypothetical protein